MLIRVYRDFRIATYLYICVLKPAHIEDRRAHEFEINFFDHPILSIPECPPTLSGKKQFYCPSRNEGNEWICVTSEQFCDTKVDCPNGQDEDVLMCFYHRPVSVFLNNLKFNCQLLNPMYSNKI